MGLGFTAVLVDGDFIRAYQDHLRVFLSYHKFTENPERIAALSLAIAEMISLSAYLFRSLDYPEYYDYFAAAWEYRQNRHTPVFALTAHLDAVHQQQSIAAGMNAVLSKPLAKETAFQILKELNASEVEG